MGIVDRPANKETFITLKSEGGVPDEASGVDQGAGGTTPAPDAAPVQGSPADGGAKPLSMPQAVKDALTQGMQSCLNVLSGVAEAVAASTVDDTAQAPVDLFMRLDEAADQLDALADQYANDGAPGGMGEALLSANVTTTPVEGEAQKSDKTPKMVSGRKARLIAKKRFGVLADVHKAIKAGHDGIGEAMKSMDGMMQELSGETPDNKSKGSPKAPEKTDAPPADANSSPNDEKSMKAFADIANTAVTAALGPFMALLTATSKAVASTGQLPNASVVEGDTGGPPPKAREPSYKEKLEAQRRVLDEKK